MLCNIWFYHLVVIISSQENFNIQENLKRNIFIKVDITNVFQMLLTTWCRVSNNGVEKYCSILQIHGTLLLPSFCAKLKKVYKSSGALRKRIAILIDITSVYCQSLRYIIANFVDVMRCKVDMCKTILFSFIL